ncbi:MAG: PH domain-containing protein [Aquificaceae bacterium]|nr:PH domain-containing protein [Aquificaceae bacterium]MDW8424133.1 PH domain-containing protein [Aquificaceae bacterium]
MEKFLYKGKQHWICLAWSMVIANLVLLIVYIPLFFVSPLLTLVTFLFANILLYLSYRSNWFYVKKDRVGQVSGIIAKNTHEILLSKGESVHVRQSVVGRLLNYGTLVLVGTGGTPHDMKCIPSVDSVREIIVDIIKQDGK